MFSILLAGIIAGCGGSKEVTIDPNELIRKVEASYRSTPDLTLAGEMKSNAAPVTITFDAWIRKTERLKMVLNGPFGMSVGAMAATPETFTFVSVIEGIVYSGRPDRATFEQAARLPMSYDDLVALLRAEIPQLPTAEQIERGDVTVDGVGGGVRFVERRDGVTITFVVDPDDLTISSYVQRSGDDPDAGEKLLEVEYKTFVHTVGERKFPEIANLRINGGETWVKVTVDEAAAGIDDDVRMEIDVPDGFDRREL